MLVVVVGIRTGLLGVFLCVSWACSLSEPTPLELARAGAANLKSARTTHIEGTGSFSIAEAFSRSFDFKLSGDTELPDKTRMHMQISTPGTALSLDTISIAGKSYSRRDASGLWSEDAGDAHTNTSIDPFSSADLTAIRDVVEVDRPIIDGRKTRHLRYSTDGAKLLDAMRLSAGEAGPSVARPHGSGELWIRVDDSQIVRQRVAVSFEMAGLDVEFAGMAVGQGTATFAISVDMRFSRHGERLPSITPPPTR
jgi:hypothetical protein